MVLPFSDSDEMNHHSHLWMSNIWAFWLARFLPHHSGSILIGLSRLLFYEKENLKMSFSGMVKIKLDDIDDYIGPGNECTKPVKVEKTKTKVKVKGNWLRNITEIFTKFKFTGLIRVRVRRLKSMYGFIRCWKFGFQKFLLHQKIRREISRGVFRAILAFDSI